MSVNQEGYNGLNAKRSATSTFIGLRFSEDKIQACVVGDSCLFVLTNKQFKSYPLKRSEDFNDCPEYFATYPKDNHFQPHFFDINLEQSDNSHIILATDALSEYILKCHEHEQNINVFYTLLNILSPQDLEKFVASARHKAIKMKNDDVTLLILRYNSASSCNSSQTSSILVENESKSSIVSQDFHHTETSEKINSTQDPNFNLNSVKHSIPPTKSQKKEHCISYFSKNNSKTINHLKQQRACLIVLAVGLPLLSFWIGRLSSNPHQPTTQTIDNYNVSPRYIKLEVTSKIYADQQLTEPLIMSLSNLSEGLILEEGDRWIKFQLDLYAYHNTINSCPSPSCSGNELEIRSAQNIQLFPSESPGDIFGELSKNTKFKKLQFNSIPNWHKFRFVGYIAQ